MLKDNWTAVFLVAAGTLIVIGSLLLTAFLTENINKNFLLDAGYAVGERPVCLGHFTTSKKAD